MILKGTSDNYVNASYGTNWEYATDEPVNSNKFYFEAEILNSPRYSAGGIGISDRQGHIGTALTNYFGVSPFMDGMYNAVYYADVKYNSMNLLRGTDNASSISKILGFGFSCRKDSTKLDYYIDDKLHFSVEAPIALDPQNTFVVTFNTWNHNTQTAKYYFGKEVNFPKTKAKYFSKFIYLINNAEVYGAI